MLSEIDLGPPAPCPEPFNMAAHVLAHADARPDKVALAVLGLTGAERWNYARLKSAVLGTATGLLRQGLAPGDIVLMRLGNTPAFPVAYLGAIAAGLVPVPTSPQLTAAEVGTMIDTLAPGAILHAPGVTCPASGIPVISQAALEEMYALPPAPWHMGDPDRLAYIVYTSGTSGVPRAVMHAHRAIWARRMMVDGWYGLRPGDRLCHAGAFNWTYTLGTGLMDPWATGATALIAGTGVGHDQLPLLMKRHDATIFAAAPGVFRKILQSGAPLSLPRLRHGLSAGEKLSDTIRAGWHAATGTAIYEAYGMSECSTFISSSPAAPADPVTLGRPQPGRHIAILGSNGRPVPLGEEGTIAVHRSDPGLMLGYMGAEAETAARFAGGWFLTGDQGAMDGAGQVTYMGRGDDMMNAGGYRVSPVEVEAVLAAFPGLTQAAATDIEVRADARVIMAFYTSPAPLDEAALAAHVETNLAPYKRPRAFHRVEALPTNPNGKLQRQALKSVYRLIADAGGG